MRWSLGLIGLLLAGVGPAFANEASEALDARGLIELNAGQFDEAMSYFEGAVQADPEDLSARYHRGVGYAREQRFAEAVADLEMVMQARPDFAEAALELGIALLETGRHAEARRRLEQAQAVPALEAQATFFLGLVHLREERLDEARASFRRARAKDPSLEVASRYYEGVAAYRDRDDAAARDHFTFVRTASPDTTLGRESAAFLELLRRGARVGRRLYGAVAVEYDSNVTLAPSDVLVGPVISGKEDGRVTLNAGGSFLAWERARARLYLGYDFFQSLHFELTEFNLQDHRPSALLTVDLGPVAAGLLTRYDFYLLRADSLMHEITAFPWLGVPVPGVGRAEVYYRLRWRNYLSGDFEILDGSNHAVGVRQVVDLGGAGRQLWASYEIDSENPSSLDGNAFGYHAQQVETAVQWPFAGRWRAEAGYRYRAEEYHPESAAFLVAGARREDDEHRVVTALYLDLNETWSLLAAYIGTFNLSNKVDFEYDRHIGSLGVQVRY